MTKVMREHWQAGRHCLPSGNGLTSHARRVFHFAFDAMSFAVRPIGRTPATVGENTNARRNSE
jgi:hypothetical protein